MAHVVIPSVNVFIVRDGKVLLGRRTNTGWMDGYLCPPGGHVEEGETTVVAALRELCEELAMDINPTDLEFLCVAARNTLPNEFVVKDPSVEPQNNELDKCSELVWADINQLPSDVIPQFAEIIRRSLIGTEKYLELGYS